MSEAKAKAKTETLMLITPDQARRWLESSNYGNRPLSQLTVDRIRRDIEAGRWCYQGFPIAFDSDGRLLSGQHRLHAIVDAAKTEHYAGRGVTSDVRFGLPPSVAGARGEAAWTAGDRIVARGMAPKRSDGGAITSAFRVIVAVFSSSGINVGRKATRSLTDHEVEIMIDALGGDVVRHAAASVQRGASHGGLLRPATSASAVVLLLASGLAYVEAGKDEWGTAVGQERTLAFFRGLETGLGLQAGSPEAAARACLTNAKERRRRTSAIDLAAVLLRAWDICGSGEQCQVIRFVDALQWIDGTGAPWESPSASLIGPFGGRAANLHRALEQIEKERAS